MLRAGGGGPGQAGIVRMLEIMEDEVTRTLGLLGVTGFGKLDRSYLAPAAAGQCAARVLGFPVMGKPAVSVLSPLRLLVPAPARTHAGFPHSRE